MATDTPGRRWYQFSLLTMLFVVGLLVVLAAMSYHHHYWGRHLGNDTV